MQLSAQRSQLRARPAEHFRGFTSFKCRQPIHYTLRCCRDALIQATLDRHVTALEPAAVDLNEMRSFFAFGINLAGKRGLVALTERQANPMFSPPEGYAFGITLTKAQILADPIAATARTVWASRDAQVPPTFQILLLELLADSAAGIAISDLRHLVWRDEPEWLTYVLAMACRGHLGLSPISSLTENTRVFALKCDPVFCGFSQTVDAIHSS